MKFFDNILIKFYFRIHNYLYHQISKISTRLNNNIHPKHGIMRYHQFFLDNIDDNTKVFDIGCGNGYLTFKISKKAQHITGMDISKDSIEFAKKYHDKENIKYIIGDVRKYSFDEKFDVIILSNVLEHLKERVDFLKDLKKIAKYFLIRVPMIDRSWLSLYKKELGLEYRLDKTHYIEYTFESFGKEIDSAGLKIQLYSIQFGEIWAKCESI